MSKRKTLVIVGLVFAQTGSHLHAFQRQVNPNLGASQPSDVNYVLGPNDQVRIWALGMPEVSAVTYRVDESGGIDLPLVGRMQVMGLSVDDVRPLLVERLKTYVREPNVTVSLIDFGSQSVSVIGAVNNPGIHQLKGTRNLTELLSLAGGLKPEVGNSITITRQSRWGSIPVVGSRNDADGRNSIAEVNVQKLLKASSPSENIIIRPGDIVSVPRAQLVYVVGQVRKPGGFVLSERESLSVLQVLSLAEGLDRNAAPKNARILREDPASSRRRDLVVNLSKIIDGKENDVQMRPTDILYVPNSKLKAIGSRALEAAIQVSTGVIIWRR